MLCAMVDYEIFKLILKKNGLSLSDLSEKIGLSLNGIKNAFDNGSLKVRDLELICEKTKLKASDILTLKEIELGMMEEPITNYYSKKDSGRKFIELEIEDLKKHLQLISDELNTIKGQAK